MYRGRTEFRTTLWRKLWNALFVTGFSAAAVYFVGNEGFAWISLFFIGMSALSLLGFFESITEYVLLGEKEIRFRTAFRKRNVSRDDIENIVWEKGTGIVWEKRTGVAIALKL